MKYFETSRFPFTFLLQRDAAVQGGMRPLARAYTHSNDVLKSRGSFEGIYLQTWYTSAASCLL